MWQQGEYYTVWQWRGKMFPYSSWYFRLYFFGWKFLEFLHGMAISLGISVIPRGNWKQKYDEIFFWGGGGSGGKQGTLWSMWKWWIVWTPTWYVTLHSGDRRGAASLRYRNRAKITVLMFERMSRPVWSSCQHKGYPVWFERSVGRELQGLVCYSRLFKYRSRNWGLCSVCFLI